MSKEAKDELLKVLGENATDDVVTLVDSIFKNTVSNDDANARAASERRRAEKRLEELQGSLDAANADLEALKSSGGSEADHNTKLLELERAKATETSQALEAIKSELASTQRAAVLGKLTGGINFVDNMSADVRQMAIESHFKDLSLDDLSTPALADPIVQSFIESNSALIQAKTVNGGGTHGSESGTVSGSTISRASIADMEWTPENSKAAWAAAENGTLTK